MLKKLTSRKLWLAVAGVTTGIAMIFGVDGGDISTVAGAITAIVSVITYILAEGKIDAESVKKAIESTEKATEIIKEAETNDSQNELSE